LKNQVIYYCGPTETPRGKIIGAAGPTTSSRMDEFTPVLLKQGLKGMIGKGSRSKEVIAAIKKYKAVYFLTFAGCGALLSKYIKRKTLLAYKDLGPESILKLEVKDFPLIVGIDTNGRNIYAKTGR
jgi:fumarate hydratase subunit beta